MRVFLDGVGSAPKVGVAAEVAALFAAGPRPPPAPRPGRTVAAIVAAQYAEREARLLAPALRACRARGDEAETFVLPSDDESPLHDTLETVGRILEVETVRPIPRSGPVAGGLVQEELREAYHTYEFLKSRAPDVVLSTQAFGIPYFAMRARSLGVSLAGTRFVIVLGVFDLQRRLNERLVTSKPRALVRFHLERAAAEGADVCVAPSHRFVENALRTSAAAEATRFMVLPEMEDAFAVMDPAPTRPSAFVIPDAAPVARNVAFFAVVARRRPDALRDAEGRIRLYVDAADPGGELAASCEGRFAETEVTWTVGRLGEAPEVEDAVLFAPFCEDFFALGTGLAPAMRGARILVGEGAAAGEPFEAAGIAAAPFPDAVAEALTEAAAGRRALRVRVRSADLDGPWTCLFENLSPPRPPAKAPGAPWVTVCVLHFNRPGLVGQAVSSALAQTYGNLDVLIFDDGSDAPGAVEVLEELAGSHPGRVRLVRRDNRYLGASRNRAARAAKGEYVYFLDDDNVLKPRAIETLVSAAQVSGADFVGSFSDIFIGDRAPAAGAAARRILQVGSDGGISLLQNTILDGNALCRRNAFLDLGGNTEDYGTGKDDVEFFARATHSGRRVVIVPEALFWARHGQKGLKSSHFDRTAGFFRVLGAYWPALAPGYRATFLLLQGMFIERDERVDTLWQEREAWRHTAVERGERLEKWRHMAVERGERLEKWRHTAVERGERLEKWRHTAVERGERLEKWRHTAVERGERLEKWRHTAVERREQLEKWRHMAVERKERLEKWRYTAVERREQLEKWRHMAVERKERLEKWRHTAVERREQLEKWRHMAVERREQLEKWRHTAVERKARIDVLWRERGALWGDLKASRRESAERKARIDVLTSTLETAREGHFMALARRGGRFGFGGRLEIGVLLNPDWLGRAWPRSAGEPALELRCNGRVAARAAAGDRAGDAVQMEAGWPRAAVFRDVLYSVHDARTGEGLAALAVPAFVRARRVEGAVEDRDRPEVRGWVLDRGDPERSRRVAVYVDGRLRAVLRADGRRTDIARWKGTGGRHGFSWPVPEGLAEGARIDVHDADTGRLLQGSPVRVEGDRAVGALRRGA